MKALFLDVDGVLNSLAWFVEDRKKPESDWLGLRSVDPTAVARLQEVLRITGAEVVLSSTWRFVEDCKQELRNAGVSFVDETPRLETQNRGEEILAWLNAHPDVTTFAIVDDDDDAGDCGLLGRLVQTGWENGLQPVHCMQLIRLLGVAEARKVA